MNKASSFRGAAPEKVASPDPRSYARVNSPHRAVEFTERAAMSAPADAASAVEEKSKAPDPPKRFVRNQVRHRGAPPALSMLLAFRHSAAADASALHGRMRLLGARSSLVV